MRMPPEVEVLLAGARARMGPEHVEAARRASATVDWRCLVETARAHRLLPLLHRHVSRGSIAVPADTRAELELLAKRAVRRSLRLHAELVNLITRLERAGVRAAPLKGSVLAHLVYGSVAARQFGDLDVLISREDLPEAIAVLGTAGYRAPVALSSAQERLRRRSDHHVSLASATARVSVELHYSLFSMAGGKRYGFDLVAPRLERVGVGGAEMWSLAPEDCFVYLCQHGAAHAWSRLEWIATAAELDASLVRREDRVREMSELLDGAPRVAAARALAASLLGTRRDRAPQPPRRVARANDIVVRRLRTDPGRAIAAGRDLFAYQLRTDRNALARARRICTMLIAPQPTDLESIRLPRAVWPLYSVVRLLRLLTRHGRLRRPVA